LKKPYLFLCLLLALIVSCSSAPRNREQVTENREQAPAELATAEPDDTIELSDVTDSLSEPEEPVLAETSEEEKSKAEYVSALSLLDDSQEIIEETEAQSVIAMETLRPVGQASPAEETSPVRPSPPSGTQSPAEPVSPQPAVPKPVTPALPEQRTVKIAPPARESLQPKDDTLAIAQEPAVEEPQEERILLPDYPITFSRTARVTVGQLVEIPFRGKDWVFLGEIGARRGIAYDSRKTDPEGDSFIFRVDSAGTYALKFYKQDFAHDLILNDHVQIIAGGTPETTGLGWFNPPVDRSKVVAGPRWPNFIEQPQFVSQPPVPQPTTTLPEAVKPPLTVRPPAETVKPAPPAVPPAVTQPPPARQPARNETTRPQGLSGGSAVAQANPAQPEPPSPTPVEIKSPDAILKEARDEFNAGRIASAITLLDEFRKSYPSGSDEAWWLYGQCYEANSPNRNMLSALDYYRRLVREYPMSSRLSDARRRIAYLERYYINIQ